MSRGGELSKTTTTPSGGADEERAEVEGELDDEGSERTFSLIQSSSTFETYSGPAPHPDLLERYDRIVPGAAREFLDAVREERLHRHRGDEVERQIRLKLAEAEIAGSRLGLIFGFVIGMTGLIVACICALTDHEMTAAIVAGVDLLALVAVFVTGRVYEARRSEPELPAESTSSDHEPPSVSRTG